jgi:hypothetical protein
MMTWMTLGPIMLEARLERPKRPKYCMSPRETTRGVKELVINITMLSYPGGVNSR